MDPYLPSPPLTADVLDRPRLIAAIIAHRVVVIRAEAGAGKTFLASTFAAATPSIPVLTVALDDSCRSRHAFWYRALVSLQTCNLAPLSVPLQRFLLGDLDVSHVPALFLSVVQQHDPLCVIVDDIHLLKDEAQQDLKWLAEHAPRLRLIVTTRTQTSLEEPAAAARLDTRTVTSQELAFSPEEVAALGRSRGLHLTPAEAGVIAEVSGGNALAVRVALSVAETVTRSADDRPLRAELRRHAQTGVIRGLTPQLRSAAERDAMLRWALAPEVDPTLAARTADLNDVSDLLRRFEYDGVGRVREHDGARWFSFHPLVASELERKAEETLPAEEVRAIRLAAAAHLEGPGDPVAVLRLLVKAREDAGVWPVFAKRFSDITLVHVQEAIEAIRTAGRERISATPTLAIALGSLLFENSPEGSLEAERLLSAALRQLADAPTPRSPVDRFWRQLSLLAAQRGMREYERASEAGAIMSSIVRKLSTDEAAELGSAVYTGGAQAVITHSLAGKPRQVIMDATVVAADPNPFRAFHVSGIVAYAQASRGTMKLTRRTLRRRGQDVPEALLLSVVASGWHAAHALMGIETGDPDASGPHLSALEHQLPATEYWADILWLRALSRLATGETALGAEELRSGLDASRGRRTSTAQRDRVQTIGADLAVAAGDLVLAQELIDRTSPGPYRLLGEARLLLARGDLDRAEAIAAALALGTLSAPRLVAERLLLGATTAARRGNARVAAEDASRAMQILRVNALTTPALFVPRNELVELVGAAEVEAVLPRREDPFGHTVASATLTSQERRVLRELATGATLRDIAQSLGVSSNTIKTQLRSIYRKLEVTGRDGATAAARGLGLLGDVQQRRL